MARYTLATIECRRQAIVEVPPTCSRSALTRYDQFFREEEAMNIFVGSLSFEVADADLRQAFEAFGQVVSATVIKDKFSGESRGFGFVEMPDKAQAQAAMKGLNGQDLKGRRLTVNEARPRTEPSRARGRGGGRRSF